MPVIKKNYAAFVIMTEAATKIPLCNRWKIAILSTYRISYVAQ
jgi:hypothetical protein